MNPPATTRNAVGARETTTTTTRPLDVQVLFRTDTALDRGGLPRRAPSRLVRADYRTVAIWKVEAETPAQAAEVAWSRAQNRDTSWATDPSERSMMIGDAVVVVAGDVTTRLVVDFIGFKDFGTWGH